MADQSLLDDEALPVSPRRAAFSKTVVATAQPILVGMARHWLLAMNAATVLLIGGALAAPLLLAAGLTQLSTPIYQLYHATCHQWASRSFFLFGQAPFYTQTTLEELGHDAFTFVGDPQLGWKMAFCERDLAIYAGLLMFGFLYGARWRGYSLRQLTWVGYVVLAAPMALDGFTQLFGLRESTWELRVATGLLFGMASAWFLYPRFDRSLPQALTA